MIEMHDLEGKENHYRSRHVQPVRHFETMLEITQPPCPAGGHLQHGVDYAKHHLSPRSAPKKDILHEVPVLIVGGGPTGLLTAYMLSRHGGASTQRQHTHFDRTGISLASALRVHTCVPGLRY